MTDPAIRTLASSLQSTAASAGTVPAGTLGVEQSFQSLLGALLMSFNLGDQSQGSLSMNSLMAPLMFGLLEQLLSQQISSANQGEGQVQQNAQAAGSTSTGAPGTVYGSSGPVPHGFPVDGRLTQGSHPGHVAIDLGVPIGTPVKSTMDGKVIYAGWNDEGYGNLVIVENGSYRTYYAHLNEIPVSVGQQVAAGSVIGLSGSTGNSTGPHVHYEVRVDGQQVDPLPFTGS